jgi:hypothetical protein
MRAIFLNTWSGKVERGLLQFISKQSSATSTFCLSEVTPTLYKKLQFLLDNFGGYFAFDDSLKNSKSSQVVFVNKELLVLDYKKLLLYDALESVGGTEVPAFVQAVDLGSTTVLNLQGMAYPGDKLDSEDRLTQSAKIIDFAHEFTGPKIIGGDFNLMPDTESVKVFEASGYKNLIKDFKVRTTRNDLADHTKKDKQYFGKQYFADYCFISPEVKVKKFEVPYLEISDHLPLILDFEV